MISQLTISQTPQELALDYQQLYAIGLKHVQQLSSQIWTDYNVHDPGITTLELLCYALTDLSYRASFPIEDLLASASDNAENMKQQFFTARQILPSRPLTLLDYRKLLIDIKNVKNAWLQPASLAYYADIVNSFNSDAENILEPPRLGCATLFIDDIIDLPSLAAKLHQPAESDRLSQYLKTRLTTQTKAALSAYQTTPDNRAIGQLLKTLLVQDFNQIIQNITVQNGVNRSISLYEAQRFAGVNLSDRTLNFLNLKIGESDIERLNRMLLEDAYSQEILQNQWLRERQKLKQIHLAGLYQVKIEYAVEITPEAKQEAMQSVRQKLQANRNLCEEFVQFNEVETQDFQLCAELELTPDANVTQVKADILSQVQQYLSPSVRFYSLSEMLARQKTDGTPYTVDEIFDGPALDRGFIDDEELENADLRTEIRLSDIISIIMDIAGVQAVRDIVINPEGNKIPLVNKWVIPVEAGKQAKLNPTGARLVFYKRNMPVVAGALTDTPASDPTATATINDLEIPLGNYRDLASYYSFQNHFPAIYGLSEAGLSSAADDKRQALAYQLKAYLLFFDQIMANYLVQLSHVKELFAIDPNLRQTYFYQVVNSFADYSKIYATNNIADTLQAENDRRESDADFDRRHRFLDSLISRFAERVHDLAHTMYSNLSDRSEKNTKIIEYKCNFLRNYPAISSDRALAYNSSLAEEQDLWNSENVSGLEKRLTKFLGITSDRRQDLAHIDYNILAETEATFGFQILNKDSNAAILRNTESHANREKTMEVMKETIHFGLDRQHYQNRTAGDKYYFSIIDDTAQEIARSFNNFDTEDEMNEAMKAVIAYLNSSFEGMYLIENILLWPDLSNDPFLPICPNQNCTDCPEADPYSYRIHIILPAYGSRFGNIEFRRFAEEVIRKETPAHILPKICWIGKENMSVIEKLYRDWIYLKAGVDTTQRQEKLRNFIKQLFAIKNVYPQQNLSDCDSGEDQPKFILGRTVLGTAKKIKK